jgi:HSP20 family protein
MFRDLMTLQDRMNRIFGEVFPALPRRQGNDETQENVSGDWTPAVDIYENENTITLKADIPGIDPEKLEIRVDANRLLIKGERTFEKETKQENFYRVERSYGAFFRSFILPSNVQPDRIEANYNNGVLTVTLPKREDARPKTVRVKVNEQQGDQIRTEGQSQENRR